MKREELTGIIKSLKLTNNQADAIIKLLRSMVKGGKQ